MLDANATIYLPETRTENRSRGYDVATLRVDEGVSAMVDALVSDGWEQVTAAITVTVLVRQARQAAPGCDPFAIAAPSWLRARQEAHAPHAPLARWIRRQVRDNPSAVLSALGR